MNPNGAEQGRVVVSDGRIIVTNLELTDEDLADYLSEFLEPERTDIVRKALKIGLIALKGSAVAEKVDYVQKEFQALQSKLDTRLNKFTEDVKQQLERFLSQDGGIMKTILEKYLGTGGRLEDFFDPDRRDSALSKISTIFDEHFKGRDSIFYKQLDPTNPESPIAALKKELVENYLQKIRDHIVGEELVEAEYEKGTAKGRDYQDNVFIKISEISTLFYDIPDRV